MIEMNEIIGKFAREGILIEDNAYFRLKEMDDPATASSEIIVKIKKNGGGKFTLLTSEMLDDLFELTEEIDNPAEIKARGPINVPREREFDFRVITDTSKRSYTSGEIGDMISYFNSRFSCLRDLLKRRPELKSHVPIADLRGGDDAVSIIGIINEIRTTKNNHRMLELEDDTGEITVVVHNENHKLFEKSEKLVRDEVIGVQGAKKGRFVVASEIFHPGVPRIQEKEMDFSVAFISDVHIGSQTFLEDAFTKFVKWINGDFGTEDQMNIAADIKYLVVAGDIVDGIGIYPGQEKELIIRDINEQYEEAARLFGEIRDDIKIVMIPGNHDASRIAEPQPAIPEEYAKPLYSLKNVEFLSNPSMVSLDGIKTLIYHGRSFDDMAMSVNGLSHERSDLIMEELLEKRHLAPIYGERTPLASEIEDHLVIDDVPHILHTGHVHINAYKKYKGIHLINSGTFQSQTEFQKIYNIVPTCGQVPVLNRGIMKLLEFN